MDDFTGSPGQGSVDDATRQVKQSAETIAHSAKEAVSREAEAGAQRVAGAAQSLASTLRSAADAAGQENGWVSDLLAKSADGVERATSSLSTGDFSGALREVNSFARRQPAIFLGVCLAVGFAAARVGKSAVEQSSASDDAQYI